MKINKTYVKFLIFTIAILFPIFYAVTAIHEIGHAIVDLSYGCKNLQIRLYPIWQKIWGTEECLDKGWYSNDEKWYSNMPITQIILLESGGALITLFIGTIFLHIFNSVSTKKVNKLILLFLFWFATSNLLSAIWGQILIGSFSQSSDIKVGINYFGWNQNLIIVIGLVLIVMILYPISKSFKRMLKIIEPRIKDKKIKIALAMFYSLLGIFTLVFVLI